MKLGLVDTTRAMTIYVDEDGEFMTGIMTQGTNEDLTVNYMVSRELTITEKKLARMERLLIAANWIINKLSKYTYYAPKIFISFPHPAEIHFSRISTNVPPRLQAKLIELSTLPVEFTVNESAWSMLSAL